MFRPIKNFISYFQKSTNGTGIFGSTTNTTNNVDETENMENKNILDSSENNKINENDKINETVENNTREKDKEETLLTSTISSCSPLQKTIQSQHDQNENEVCKEISNNLTSTIPENCTSIDNIINPSLLSCSSPTPKNVELINFPRTEFSSPINVDVTSTEYSIEITSPSCSPIKIICDPLIDNSPTKIYVNGNKNFKCSKDINKINNSNDDLLLKTLDNDDEIIVDEEIIVISDNDNNSNVLDSGSDPLALDDCHIEDNLDLLQNHSSSSSINETDGIICIINVDNIKETNNSVNNGSKNTLLTNYNESSKNSTNNYDILNGNVKVGNEEQELRSDGSDSGLGLETSTNLQIPTTSNTNINTTINFISEPQICHLPVNIIPRKSNLKRRLNDDPIISLAEKKTKRSIHFNGVSVYYFPRMQGFACVPSQGGCTLGMGSRHVHYKTFSLTDYAAEQRRVHKQQMQDINPRSSSSDETDSDEEISEASGSDLDADGSGFLQPVPTRQRRALLKAAGIRKIDPTEKDECRSIRTSREFCGCSCRGYCDPDTCSCSQAGIKCQVDRPSFPCGCTRDGCANVVGRIEFNPGRVRTHFIHTIMRLDIENKQKRRDEIDISTSSITMPMLNYMNNCVSDNSNLPITATLNSCSNSNNSLSNICNYSVSNASHIGGTQQSYHLHNQNFINTTLYSNIMNNNSISATSFSQDNISTTHQQQQHLIGNNCMHMNLTNSTNSTHSIDLSYPLRDMTTENPMCNSLMIDFPTNSNQIFHHDVYSSQSYVNQSYHNQNLINSPLNSNYHLTATNTANTYSNYQQNYIPYLSQNCTNVTSVISSTPTIEIHDLATPDDDISNSYINLHPPTANSSRLDAINLLHNNRNTPPTAPIVSSLSPTPIDSPTTTISNIIDPLPMKPTTVSALSEICNLAPSAQTSTSIAEGTSTSVVEGTATKASSPIIVSGTSSSFGKSSSTSVVDLTEELEEIENITPRISATVCINEDFEQIIESLEIFKNIESSDISETKKVMKDNNQLMLTASEISTTVNFSEETEKNNLKKSTTLNTTVSCNNDLIDEKNKIEDSVVGDVELIGISLNLNKTNDNENKDNEEIDKNQDIIVQIDNELIEKNQEYNSKCTIDTSMKKDNFNEISNKTEETQEKIDTKNDENIEQEEENKNDKNIENVLNNCENIESSNENTKRKIPYEEKSKKILGLKNHVPDSIDNDIEKNNENNIDIIIDSNNSNIINNILNENTQEELNNTELNIKSMDSSLLSSLSNNVSIANESLNKSQTQSSSSSSVENDENLTDIIQKSIVETVSA